MTIWWQYCWLRHGRNISWHYEKTGTDIYQIRNITLSNVCKIALSVEETKPLCNQHPSRYTGMSILNVQHPLMHVRIYCRNKYHAIVALHGSFNVCYLPMKLSWKCVQGTLSKKQYGNRPSNSIRQKMNPLTRDWTSNDGSTYQRLLRKLCTHRLRFDPQYCTSVQ